MSNDNDQDNKPWYAEDDMNTTNDDYYAEALDIVRKNIQAKLEYKYNTPKTKFITTGDVLNEQLDFDKQIELKMFFEEKELRNFLNTLKGMQIHYEYQIKKTTDPEKIKENTRMLEFVKYKNKIMENINPSYYPNGGWIQMDDYDVFYLKKAYEECNGHIAGNIFDEEGEEIQALLPEINFADFIDRKTEFENVQYYIDKKIEDEFLQKNKEMLKKIEMEKEKERLIEKILHEQKLKDLKNSNIDLDKIMASKEYEQYEKEHEKTENQEIDYDKEIDEIFKLAGIIRNKESSENNKDNK